MIVRSDYALSTTPVETLDAYVERGGLTGLATALAMAPFDVIDMIELAGVRGRGGAGFPTALKWRGLATAKTASNRGFVVVNAAEGEPGTFKDRALLRANPYLVLEGALIAAHCLGASRLVVATKAIYTTELERLRDAIDEFNDVGALGDVDVQVVEGPDHYLFGEETALLEVIEGEDPLPRQLPPYLYGLFTASPNFGWSVGPDDSPGGVAEASDNPALVNNVETYAHAALVCTHGPDWYRSIGTVESPGPTIVTITGDVQRPVVAEIELGQSLREVITELTGGALPGRRIKAVLSGVANPVLTGDALDAPISYEGLGAVGSSMGSAGFIVFDDSRNLVDIAYQVSRFLHIESCGQCNPCKTGTHAITVALERIVAGRATAGDVATIERRLVNVTDASRCYLPTQEQRVVTSLLQADPDDLDRRLAGEAGDPGVQLPKLVDITDGVVTIDPRLDHKRPDWTYSETPVVLLSGVT